MPEDSIPTAADQGAAGQPDNGENIPVPPIQPQQNTVQQQQPMQSQQAQPQAGKPIGGMNIIGIVSIILIIVILLGVVSFLSSENGKVTTINTTTSSIVSTAQSVPTSSIVVLTTLNNCTTIATPGQYLLGSNIYTSTPQSCMIIEANNVELLGQGHLIHGAGPYVAVPPFTYGVYVGDASNVTVSGMVVSNFSYGIFISGSENADIYGNNASEDVVSGIYLLDSAHNSVSNNLVSFVQSDNGAIEVNNSYNNTFENNLVRTNAQVGIFVNGTGNAFYNNTASNNPVDFSCNPLVGISKTNIFESTTCSTNLECDFLQCSLNNIPVNLSSIPLPNKITSCGGIYGPGNYTLEGNLYATDFLNTSWVDGESESCITILAPQVNLNCQGHTIANAGTGILVDSVFANITNCVLVNNTYGISSNAQINVQVHNTSVSKGTYGIYLNQVTGGSVDNVTVSAEGYGVYLYNSTGVEFSSLNATGNTYGVYMQQNPENAFKNTKLFGNSNEDLFCDAATYSSTSPIFQHSSCGVTDCNWASSSCSKLVLPPLANIPLTSCGSITSPGNYTVQQNIYQSSTCIDIEANNVNLNCNNKLIFGLYSGSGIEVDGGDNVSIANCDISKFFNGINITDSSDIRLSNITENNDRQGAAISGSTGINLTYANIYNMSGNYGVLLSRSTQSIVSNVTLEGGNPASSGFLLNMSNGNLFSFDNVDFAGAYGFTLINSTLNTMENDSSTSASKYDFYCAGTSTGIYSESGPGINSGISKYKCPWLVEVNPFSTSQCYPVQKSGTITLTSDLVYPYGQTCYNMIGANANNTVVNCNYHTVLATDGGSFVSVLNSYNIGVENCYLKGFTNAISYVGGSLTISGNINNNTIATVTNGISVDNAFNLNIYNNTILNATSYGIYYDEGRVGSIGKNKLDQVSSCIYMLNGSEDNVNNNLCNIVSNGITFYNNSQPTIKNNTVLGASAASFYCGLHSNTSSSFAQDLGGNVCTSGSNNCLWMTNSPSCQPS